MKVTVPAGTVLCLIVLAAMIFTGGLANRAHAHPHVWVTVETKLLFNEAGQITGFRHKWIFDEYYTAFALQGMDRNGDGEYDDEELEPLAKTNIESLNEFDYFTFAKLDGRAVPRKDPVDYNLIYKNGLLELHFTLPMKEPVQSAKAGSFTFSVYDPTYFVDFTLAKENPIMLANDAPANCKTEIGQAPMAEAEAQSLSEAFFESLDGSEGWGAQFARTVALRCRSAS